MSRTSLSVPVIWCLVAAALFGVSTPASKFLLGGVGPLTLAGLLYLGAAIGVLPFSFKGGTPQLRREPRNLRHLACAVFFGGVAGPVLLLIGLRSAAAADVSLWLNLESIFTAILAALFFREHLGKRIWIAVFLICTASMLLAAPERFGEWRAATLVALACLCWGADNNFTSVIDGYTPAQSTLTKGLIAGLVNLSLGIWLEGNPPGAFVIGKALLVGVFSYGLSILLYIQGAQHLGASRSQMLFATSPFIGTVTAWLFLGEAVTSHQVGAIALMATGLSLLLAGSHRHEHTHEPLTHTHSHRHDDSHHEHIHPGLPPGVRHTHVHTHDETTHSHPHAPDLHHRHEHK